MNYSEIRDETIRYLGEYHNQAVASSSFSSYTDTTVLERIKRCYKRVRREAVKRGPEHFTKLQSFTYAAEAEYIDLSTVPTTSMKFAQILELQEYTNANVPSAMKALQRLEFEKYINRGSIAGVIDSQWCYYVEGFQLYLIPRPASARTIRAKYIQELDLAAVTTSNWTSNSPAELPDEHHDLIAIEAAASFFMERGGIPPDLRDERNRQTQALIEWAADDRDPSTRRVVEVD